MSDDRDWKALYEEEYRTVDRCWKALGVTTYEQAGDKAIWEIIAEQRAALEEMLFAHSLPNIGVDASMRRIKAKERARAALAKATGD
jgi:hypothetical protein